MLEGVESPYRAEVEQGELAKPWKPRIMPGPPHVQIAQPPVSAVVVSPRDALAGGPDGGHARSVTEKRTVIYEGPHALTSALASMLKAEGLDVLIHDKDEFQHATPDMATIVELTVSGVAAATLLDATRAGIAAFKRSFPDAADVRVADDEPRHARPSQ